MLCSYLGRGGRQSRRAPAHASQRGKLRRRRRRCARTHEARAGAAGIGHRQNRAPVPCPSCRARYRLRHLDYLARNQRRWTEWSSGYAKSGRRSWAAEDPTWGIWNVPDSEVHVLPEATDRDVLELGCGTAYVSSWIQRRGGRPVGLDPTTAQLETAARFQHEFDIRFPLVQAVAENVPLADGGFDVIISEYGASIWADPYKWVPEASRLLRAGGELVFLLNSMLLMLCLPEADEPTRLRRISYAVFCL